MTPIIQRKDMTAEIAREWVSYDPEAGTFKWLRQSGRRKPGQSAGYLNPQGYTCIQLCGFSYSAHRLAWLISHGGWPAGQIDHINGERNDNRLINLRPASMLQQRRNAGKRQERRGGSSPYKGVSFDKRHNGRWFARIKLPSGTINLGGFPSAEAAALAYDDAALRHFGEFARLNFPGWRSKTKTDRAAFRRSRPLPET